LVYSPLTRINKAMVETVCSPQIHVF